MDDTDEPGNARPSLLTTVDCLAGLGPDVIEAMSAKTRLLEVSAGQEILGHLDADRSVFFLIRGRVRVDMVASSGRQITYDILEPGEMFGELAAIDGQPRSASVSAEDNCTLGVISGEDFLALSGQHVALAHSVMQRLARLSRGLAEKVFEYHTYNVRGRIYAELLRRHASSWAQEHGATEAITARDMASRVGTTRENATRILGDISKKGIISRDPQFIRVLDPEALEKLLPDCEFG